MIISENALVISKNNRTELENVLSHYHAPKDDSINKATKSTF